MFFINNNSTKFNNEEMLMKIKNANCLRDGRVSSGSKYSENINTNSCENVKELLYNLTRKLNLNQNISFIKMEGFTPNINGLTNVDSLECYNTIRELSNFKTPIFCFYNNSLIYYSYAVLGDYYKWEIFNENHLELLYNSIDGYKNGTILKSSHSWGYAGVNTENKFYIDFDNDYYVDYKQDILQLNKLNEDNRRYYNISMFINKPIKNVGSEEFIIEQNQTSNILIWANINESISNEYFLPNKNNSLLIYDGKKINNYTIYDYIYYCDFLINNISNNESLIKNNEACFLKD